MVKEFVLFLFSCCLGRINIISHAWSQCDNRILFVYYYECIYVLGHSLT